MKNRRVLIIFISLIGIILICFFYIKKFNNIILNNKIYDKNWYSYNISNGYYDTFYINDNTIKLNKIDNNKYETCNKYYFNKRNNTFNLNCDEKIKILKIEKNKLSLNIDNKDYIFFDNIEDSLNYEFEIYFGKNLNEYKKSMKRVLDLIKIETNSIKDLFVENDYSKFILVGNNCNNYECVIALSAIEKLVSTTENVYYVDLENIDQKDLDEINKIDNNFSNNIKDYDRVYPLVIITNNGKIVDKYDIKCNGFDCSKYEKNEF